MTNLFQCTLWQNRRVRYSECFATVILAVARGRCHADAQLFPYACTLLAAIPAGIQRFVAMMRSLRRSAARLLSLPVPALPHRTFRSAGP